MSACCSSDEMASSHTSSNREFMTTGSDVETRSHCSLADSLESEALEVNGEKSTEASLQRSSSSRLPRLQRSHTFNTKSPVNKSGIYVDARKDERNARGRFSIPRDDISCLPHADCGGTNSLCHWNSDGKAQVRENTTSKRRFELQHSLHEREAETPEYITPSQRKDHLIKDLKAQVRELKQTLQHRDMEAEQMKLELKEEAAGEVEKRNEELENVRKELEDMKCKYEDLTKSYEESVKAVTTMEQTMDELKTAMECKEKEQEKLYLQMYRKGRQVAQIEREEELEDMVGKGIRSPSFTIRELVRKLAVTETELAKWQSLRRKESYEEGEKPESESEATLRFLRDSFFHYLTDAKSSDDHLRAIIRIFNFDEEHRKKIAKALLDGKHLKK